jgi:glutamate-1-semialdehyde 2,1-aminomutase
MTTGDEFRQIFSRIPGGCSTAAKSPLRNPTSCGPYFATQAAGGHFTDDVGREWLDFDMALSAAILGYTARQIDEAVIQQIRKGFVFSLPSLLEAQLAERLSNRFPVAECVRFCKDGSDATSAAVRIARSVTGRSKIVAATYHGWHDWSAIHYYGAHGISSQKLGIPPSVGSETVWLPTETFAQFEAVISSNDHIAGIIVCPENWPEGDLRLLSEYCRAEQTLLIFDEIKSGIRYGLRGVSGSVGTVPDLICLGKSIANGFPLAVLGGRAELMSVSSDINFSTTAASEAASMAASLAVDDHLRAVEEWPPWQRRCAGIISRLALLVSAGPPEGRLTISGYPGNFRVHTPGCSPRNDPFLKVLVMTLAKHGVFSTGYVAPCAAHSEEDFSRLEIALTEAIEEWGRQALPTHAGS